MRPQRKIFPLTGNNECNQPKTKQTPGKMVGIQSCCEGEQEYLSSYAEGGGATFLTIKGSRFTPRFWSGCEHVTPDLRCKDKQLNVSVWTCC